MIIRLSDYPPCLSIYMVIISKKLQNGIDNCFGLVEQKLCFHKEGLEL